MSFHENRIEELIIENPKAYRELVGDFMIQCDGDEGKWILSDDDSLVSLKKYALMITDAFSLDVNQKKMVSRLHEVLKKNLIEGPLYMEFRQLMAENLSFVERLIDVEGYDLAYEKDLDVSSYLKFVGVKNLDDTQGFLERLILYTRLAGELLGIRLIVITNLKNMLDEEELVQFYVMCNYLKISVLLIESTERQVLEYEHRTIIDRDLCLI
ncbi:MAG: type II-A CRISPR-associated protein Csn2 [Firmicutes bacterium]|nr:type II-A CRISPR-associated protein Csn2 [Bacillota bacterium]